MTVLIELTESQIAEIKKYHNYLLTEQQLTQHIQNLINGLIKLTYDVQ